MKWLRMMLVGPDIAVVATIVLVLVFVLLVVVAAVVVPVAVAVVAVVVVGGGGCGCGCRCGCCCGCCCCCCCCCRRRCCPCYCRRCCCCWCWCCWCCGGIMGSTWSCKRGRELPWLRPRLFYAHNQVQVLFLSGYFSCAHCCLCVCFSCLRQGQFRKEEEEEDKTAAEAASAHFCSRIEHTLTGLWPSLTWLTSWYWFTQAYNRRAQQTVISYPDN